MKMIPVLVLTPAWLLGIFLQGWLNLSLSWLVGGLTLGLGLAGLAWFYNQRYKFEGASVSPLVPLCLAALCLGALRLIWAAPSTGPDGLLYYVGEQELGVVGVVSGEPSYTERSESFRLSAHEVWLPGRTQPLAVSGEIYVRTAASLDAKPGDLLQLTGRLQEPQEISGDDFPYREWLKRQGIFVTLSYPRSQLLSTNQDFFLMRWLRTASNAAKEAITANVPGEEGRLLVGILLGDKKPISKATREKFTISGVAHILAVSGSNIAIFGNLFALVLGRFLRRHTVLWFTLGAVIFYVLLVGAGPAVLRAGLMGVLAIGGLLLGREYLALIGLVASALLMTLWQPTLLMDVGFQLSFMATLGLITLARPWQEKLKKWPPLLLEGIVVTAAVEVMILPLLIFYFEQMSLVSLLTNTLAVPALPFVMATGLVAVAMGVIFGGWLPFVAQVFGGIAWLFVAYLLVVVDLCASLPFAAVALPKFHPVWLFVYYFLLGLAVWWWRFGHKSQKIAYLLHFGVSK